MEFCKAFNAKTQEMEPGAPCPTVITYYQDKSFTLDIKTPPASYFLKKAREAAVGRPKAPGPRDGRHRHRGAGARDRRSEDEGSERQRRRGGDADHPRLGAVDGHRGEGVSMAQARKAHHAPPAKPSPARKTCRVEEAVKLIKANAKAKFDETVEIAMNLGVDPRHADQMVRGTVTPAQRHRQDGPRRRLRPRREGRRGQGGRAPTSSAPRT